MEAVQDRVALKKWCKYCLSRQPMDAFEICRRIGEKVYYRQKCKKCKYARAMDRRNELRRWFADYKKRKRCERCGFADHRALVFHHRGDELKEWNIGDMVKDGLSQQAIQREAEKCIVLCANCHAILHHEERE